jgi:hypothetical protein
VTKKTPGGPAEAGTPGPLQRHRRRRVSATEEDERNARIAAAFKMLDELTGATIDNRRRRRIETRLRTLDPKDADAIDRLEPAILPKYVPSSLVEALERTAATLRQLGSGLPASRELMPLNECVAWTAGRSIFEAADEVAHLAEVAKARKVTSRRRELANDLAIRQLAQCWRIAFGEWPPTSPTQRPDETSVTGAVRVLDTGPFAAWAVAALRLLRPDHPAASGVGQRIAGAFAGLKQDHLDWCDYPGEPPARKSAGKDRATKTKTKGRR